MMGRTYKPFSGPFAPMCEAFIRQKRTLGYKYISGYWILYSFDSFSKRFEVHNYELSKEIVEAWSRRRLNESETHRSARVLELQKFAVFLNQQGYSGHLAPPHRHTHSSHTPYIFTHEEIQKLIARSAQSAPTPYSPFKHLVFPMLYRMLYGCGFRISELLALSLQDVDTKNGIIHIRHGKNDNERYVPMSPSLTAFCRDYVSQAHADHSSDYPFFFKKDGGRYTTSNVEKDFRELLWHVGIPYKGRNFGPRVHDIRHTFVCHKLNEWAREDADLMSLLPVLSKYIGHNSLSATQWYLRLTAEVFPDITEKMNALTGHVFPEVGGELL